MKLLKLFIIAFLVILAGCTEPEETNDTTNEEELTEESVNEAYLKCGRWDGTVTFPVFAQLTATSKPIIDPELDGIDCGFHHPLPIAGNLSGFINILGRLNEEKSTYERISCSLDVSTGEPISYSVAEGQAVGRWGHKIFRETHSWTNLAQRTITGYSLITGGTGIYEGATGRTELEGVLNEDMSGTYKERGEIILVVKRHWI